jgi:S-formylglutathione hydrolase FrmB
MLGRAMRHVVSLPVSARSRASLLVVACGWVVACGGAHSTAAPAAPSADQPAAVATRATAATGELPSGEVHDQTFHSPSLGVDKRYYVYLPAGYAGSERRYPVIYLLHGLGGNEAHWSKHLGLPEAADALALATIVVMPDGDDSFYVNWVDAVDYDACLQSTREFGREPTMASYCVRQARYEDYLVRDLVAEVDRHYRTIAERRGRAISGLSMGGYGALAVGLRNRDVFSAVASHAGVASLLYAGPRPYAPGQVTQTENLSAWFAGAGRFGAHFERIFGADLAHWRAHDPATLAAALTDGELALYLDCGTDDEFQLDDGAQHLHEVLAGAGVGHDFTLVPGGRHDLPFWRDRIDDSLRFLAAHLARPE